ncbi:MAG: hypothetical protein SA339_05885 [Methanomassiliicoccus sp.]|nr:hypothetical protein [Methanomassiliicoccus sp.]
MITPDFSAYAVGADLHLHDGVSSVELTRRIEGLLAKIASECMRSGADLIGHIKCIVETEGKGFLAVSVVDASSKPQARGHLDEGVEELEIIINVLLYGLKRSRIQEIVDPLVRQELSLPGGHLTLEDLGKEHDHSHGDDHHHHEHHHEHSHDHGHEHN